MIKSILYALLLTAMLPCSSFAQTESNRQKETEMEKKNIGDKQVLYPMSRTGVGSETGDSPATGKPLQADKKPGPCAKWPMAADGIVRLSKIEVYPEHLEAYREYAVEVGEISLRTEPGVLTMYAVSEKENPCRITILETYASQEAYKSHIASEHFQKYKQGTLHMVKTLILSDQTPLNPANRIYNFIQ